MTSERESLAAGGERLTESEACYRAIAGHAADIFSRVDPTGRITYMSPSIRTVMGYEPEALIGENLLDYMHPDDLETMLATYRGIVEEGRYGPSAPCYRARHKDGRWVWLECNPTVVRDAAGQPVEFVDVTRDVTARFELEAELRQARDAAEAAAVAKGQFLANISHELRTPLTAVIGFADLLGRDEALSERGQAYAQRIDAAGRALLSVVNDILKLCSLEAGEEQLDLQDFDPMAFLDETLDLIAPSAEAKGLALEAEVEAASLPARVSADSARVRQVLLNLLSNAVKFTARGRVAVRMSHSPAAGGRLRFEVQDTGPGVAEALKPQLFQRFSQADGSISRLHGGAGLGLAIAKRLVALMDGEIGVESMPGRGSTFWFEVPARGAVPPEDDPAEAEPESADPLSVLVVDDVEANRELARVMLTALGCRCQTAVGGEDGVSRAEAEAFDIILMDMQMPGMDGLAATRAIRAGQGRNARTPIIALTANVLPPHVAACLEAGMDDHLGKPVTPAELLAKLSLWAGAEGGRPLDFRQAS